MIKNWFSKNLKFVFGLIIGVVASSVVTFVFAEILYASDETGYTHTGLDADNVQDAIDELYTKSQSFQCKTNYTKTDVTATSYICKRNENTLTVNPNGGAVTFNGNSITSAASVTQLYGTTISLPDATKENSDVYTDSYVVSYAPNGGSSTPASQVSQVSTQTSFAFNRWDQTGTCGTLLGGTYTFPTSLQTTCTMTADFTPTAIAAGVQQPVTLASAISKTGHTFSAWKASTDSQNYSAGASYTPSEDTTMTAQWTANQYQVNYNDELFVVPDRNRFGGTLSILGDNNNKYMTLDGTTTTSYHIWVGDRGRTINEGDVYRLKITYVSGSYTTTSSNRPRFYMELVTDGERFSDRTTSPVSYKFATLPLNTSENINTTYTIPAGRGTANGLAYWLYNSDGTDTYTDYKVRIEITLVHTKNVTYGSTYGTLASVAKTGFARNGNWWTAINSGTEITSSSTVSITAKQELYARWTPYTMTLKYHVNGGTVTTNTSAETRYRVGSDSILEISEDSGKTWTDKTTVIYSYTQMKDLTNVATFGATKSGKTTNGYCAYNTKANGTGINISQNNKIDEEATAANQLKYIDNPVSAIRLNGGTSITGNVTKTIYINWVNSGTTCETDRNYY